MAQMRNPWEFDPYAGTDYNDPNYDLPYDPQGAQGPEITPNAPAHSTDRRPGIAAAYQKYLGRTPQESDYISWLGNADYEKGIAGSPEAAALAKGQTYQKQYTAPPGFDLNKANDPKHQTEKYNWLRATQDAPGQDLGSVAEYYNTKYGGNAKVTGKDTVDFGGGDVDVLFGADAGINRPQFNPIDAQSPAPPVSGGGFNPNVLGGSVEGYLSKNRQPGGIDYPTFTGINGTPNDFTSLLTNSYGDILKSGGKTPFDDKLEGFYSDFLDPKAGQGRLTRNLESARETMERGRKTQLNNIQGLLADRNLLSEGGITQGPEQSSYMRLEESIAPIYAQALRDALESGDQQTLQALQQAGAFSGQNKSNLLSTLQSAGNYQGMVTQLALQSLSQNIEWQRFLANYGLDATRLENEIESGKIDDLLTLFQLHLNEAQIRAGGQV